MASRTGTVNKTCAVGDGHFHATKEAASRSNHSHQFLEVVCCSNGDVWRFAPGTEAGFAVYLFNQRGAGTPLTSHIEAFKEGHLPVCFGPAALLADYGHGWKLQTVTKQGYKLPEEHNSSAMVGFIDGDAKRKQHQTPKLEEDSSAMVNKEQEEKERKKKEDAEARLYTIIKVASDQDLIKQVGRDFFFDLVDHEKVRSFRIPNQTPFSFLKEVVAIEFDIPVEHQRFWLWGKRANNTYRPVRILTPFEEMQLVSQLPKDPSRPHKTKLNLFLEVEFGLHFRPLPFPKKTKEDLLLFFKLYDPIKEDLRYVGRLFVKALGKPIDILTILNRMASFPLKEDIELYEEIKFEPNVMCEHIDKNSTFHSSQLEDGDIICYQKLVTPNTREHLRYPDVPSFLEYVRNR